MEMKLHLKNKKRLSLLSLCLVASFLSGSSYGDSPVWPKKSANVQTLSGVTFSNAPTITESNLSSFIAKPGTSPNWNNDASDYSVITSPYYTVTSSGGTVNYPVYAANATYGLQSFCYINASNFTETSLKITYSTTISSYEIMHHASTNPSCTIQGNNLLAVISEVGQYTFVFNSYKSEALTIFIQSSRSYSEFLKDYEGCTVTTLSPGTYNDIISITSPNTVYHLTSGVYYIRRFDLLADNIGIYMDDGVYINAIMPTKDDESDFLVETTHAGKTLWKEMFNGWAGNNDAVEVIRYRGLTIEGNAIIDLSLLDFHARRPMQLNGTLDVRLSNFTITNAPEWSMFLHNCQNVEIDNVKIYGYRQNSDGICIDTCNDVVVSNCYARSGDDLFEVKSILYNAYGSTYHSENVTFTGCTAWPEKARAFGIIAEVVNDVTDIYFQNCIVIGTKNDIEISGSLIVDIGTTIQSPATVKNVHFENIRIYDGVSYPYTIAMPYEQMTGGGIPIDYIIKDIYFKNIEIYYSSPTSYNSKLRVYNYDNGNTIQDLYFDNIYVNQAKVTAENFSYTSEGYFDTSYIHVNTLS